MITLDAKVGSGQKIVDFRLVYELNKSSINSALAGWDKRYLLVGWALKLKQFICCLRVEIVICVWLGKARGLGFDGWILMLNGCSFVYNI